MSFFNSLSIRIPLAIIGAILYGALSYSIVVLLNLSSELAISGAIIVFLFYLSSRLLILFSGIDSPYYSKMIREAPNLRIEKDSFYHTAQWVGTFYHYHDIVLFILLVLFAISFLISLGVDWWSKVPPGRTAQDLWNSLIPMP